MSIHNPRVIQLRRSILAAILSLTCVLVGVLFFQHVLAQTASITLQPPYHLNFTLSANTIPPQPALAGQILVAESFDSSYAPTTTLSALGWHQVTGTLATNGYTWGRVTTGPHPDSAWVAATGLNGESILTPGTDPYTNGMESLLIYGPLDLTSYGSAVMSATYFLDSQPGDLFGVAVSTDGSNFTALSSESSLDPSVSVTHTGIYDLKSYAKRSGVWVAFYFVSNSDANVGLGAFVDDAVIRAIPLSKVYLPIVVNNYPTPVPPSVTYLYSYTFGTGSNTDPQFLQWGGTYAESCGDNCTRYGQNVSTSGNPGGAMTLYLNTLNDIVAASPNVTATTNYEYSADVYVAQGKDSARYGLIFGASLTTFGRDGSGFPTFDPNRNFYKFDLQFSDSDNTVVSYYRLQKCQNDFTSCTLIFNKTALPGGVVGKAGTWNTLKVIRNGNAIQVLVNGTQLINISDSTFIGERKFGIFIQSTNFNNATSPLKIRFDNVTLKALP